MTNKEEFKLTDKERTISMIMAVAGMVLSAGFLVAIVTSWFNS